MNASEKVLMKLATRDKGAYLLIKTAGVAGLRKYAEEAPANDNQDAGGFGDSIYKWLSEDDWAHTKQLGVGLGTAGLTYGLSALLPGARQNRLLRLLSALAVGGTAGYYGDQIVNGTMANATKAWNWTVDQAKKVSDLVTDYAGGLSNSSNTNATPNLETDNANE